MIVRSNLAGSMAFTVGFLLMLSSRYLSWSLPGVSAELVSGFMLGLAASSFVFAICSFAGAFIAAPEKTRTHRR